MSKFVKWEVSKPSKDEYVIGERKFEIDHHGISTVDIILIVISIVIIILSGVFLIRNMRALKEVNNEIQILKENNDAKQKTMERLSVLGQSEEALVEQHEKNLLLIPNEVEKDNILKDMNNVVNASGGRIKSIKYNAEEKKLDNGIMEVSFILQVECSYDQLNELLELFNETDRLYVIKKINVISSNNENTVVLTDLTISTYYEG